MVNLDSDFHHFPNYSRLTEESLEVLILKLSRPGITRLCYSISLDNPLSTLTTSLFTYYANRNPQTGCLNPKNKKPNHSLQTTITN